MGITVFIKKLVLHHKNKGGVLSPPLLKFNLIVVGNLSIVNNYYP
jgi:hypothetical protein